MTIKPPITNPVLQTWLGLNEYLRSADEQTCIALLRQERGGRNRRQFIRRIHSRLNRVRAHRERLALDARTLT